MNPDYSLRRDEWRDLLDALLARRTTRGWLPPAVQGILVCLVHLAVGYTLLPLAGAMDQLATWCSTGVFNDRPLPITWVGLILDQDDVPMLVTAAICLEGVIAYIPFRLLTRARRPLSVFMRSWWRASAWLAVCLPPAVAAGALLTANNALHPLTTADTVKLILAAALGFMLIGPTLLARDELPRRRRLSRWRPECPECGYSVRRVTRNRCPECGTTFPTASRAFRRWAVQRLSWDRRVRASLLTAYVRTVATLLICPCRAAWRLSLPDRLGRAMRFALIHLLPLAVVCALLGSNQFYIWQVSELVSPTPGMQGSLDQPTIGKLLFFAGQSFAAWLVVLGTVPALGTALASLAPGLRPAARRGFVKWALYCTPVIAAAFLVHLLWRAPSWMTTPPAWSLRRIGTPPFVTTAALAYGVWWALGSWINSYRGHRKFRRVLLHALVYIVAWLLLTRVLFNPGVLGDLL